MHLYIGYNIIELAEKGGIEMRDYVKRSWIAAVMVLVFMAQLTVAAEDMDTLAVPVEPAVLSEGQEGMAETVPDAEGGTDIIEDDADALDDSHTIPGEVQQLPDHAYAPADGQYSVQLNGICLIEKGNKCDVGAAYESNDPDVKFRWLEYDLAEEKWNLVSDWSTGNWVTWELKKAGDYWIHVEARTTDGKTAASTIGYRYGGLKTTLDGICVLDQGTHYDMGIAYTSNDTGLKFRWKIYELASQKWSLIQGEATGNWTSWEPERAGSYWVHVEAVGSDGKVITYTIPFYYGGIKTTLNGICAIERSNQIDVGAAYTSNDSKLRFQWKIYDVKADKWSELTNWSAGNWASWKPDKSGDYWVYVEAKGKDGQVLSQVMGYRVKGAKIQSLKVSAESPGWVGSEIQLTGSYQDLIGEVGKSRYLLYNGSVWTELEEKNGKVIWKPDAVGSYLLCYEIYGKDGSLIEQSFKGYSIEIPYVNLNGIYVRKTGNLAYSMAVSAQTNDRQVQYRWQYYDVAAGVWHDISGWSNSNAASWIAPNSGYYWLHVIAKLHDGTEKSYTMGYTAQRYPADLEAMMLRANNYSSSTPYIIMVNRSTHKVGVFQGWQGNWNNIVYWDCGDGAPGTPTVTGVFTVGSRGYYFNSGVYRCFWYTQFYGDYLFHSVLCWPNGAIADGRVGLAISHGCVRLQIENAKWIYDNIPSGTNVVVY